jgi:Na+-driven multidrug efflux pump
VFEATGAYDWVWYIDIVLAVGAALIHLPIREAPAGPQRQPHGRCMSSAATGPAHAQLLEGPIAPTLLRLGAPNVLLMLAQAAAGLIETWFVGKLGTDALAGMALVFPAVMLMQMMSAGAMGGGIASAIARALGARRGDDANALVFHALVIAVLFGAVFTAVLLVFGRALYARMGGTGASLDAALVYSGWVFAGAVIIWVFNALSAVIRGTGNMAVPAGVATVRLVLLLPLSPLADLWLGAGAGHGHCWRRGGAAGVLRAGHAGAGGLPALAAQPDAAVMGPCAAALAAVQDILRVGLVAAVSTIATNLCIGIATAFAGAFGPAAIAGYGTASRLEYLLVPLVFGIGGPLLAMVGTCIGAGQRERALRATWVGAALAFV